MIKVVTITSQAWNKGPEDFEGVYESSYLIDALADGWKIKDWKMFYAEACEGRWTFVLEKDEDNQTIQQINS